MIYNPVNARRGTLNPLPFWPHCLHGTVHARSGHQQPDYQFDASIGRPCLVRQGTRRTHRVRNDAAALTYGPEPSLACARSVISTSAASVSETQAEEARPGENWRGGS